MISLPPGVSPVFPEEERNMTPQQLKDSKDTQLIKAIELVGKQIG
jgi:hypothetical protein